MYKTAKELEDKIDEYFNVDKNNLEGRRTRTLKIKDADGDPIIVPNFTISDLVLFLGFCDRKSFYEYEEKPEFTHTIKKARTFIEREYEELLKGAACTGAIFALKQFNWKDKQEVEHGFDDPTRHLLLGALGKMKKEE
jgi:hypothetical protein